MTQRLKITNEANNVILYSACIAEMDYDKENVGDYEY